MLSIADGTAVTEGAGAKATFTITSRSSVTGRLPVRYMVSDGISNFLPDNIPSTPQTTTLNFNGNTTASLAFALVNDEVAEENGSVQVTLLADDASEKRYTVIAVERLRFGSCK